MWKSVESFIRVKSLSSSESTISSYRSILKRFVTFLELNNVSLDDLGVEHVISFLESVSRNSRRQYYTVVKNFLLFIGKTDVVKSLPKIRDVPRSPRALDIEKVYGGIARLVEMYVCNCGEVEGIGIVDRTRCVEMDMSDRECYRLARDIVVIWLSLSLALRRAELLGIRVGDVDVDKCMIRVRRVKARSNPDIQELEIPRQLCMFIKHYVEKHVSTRSQRLVDISPWTVELVVHRFGEMIGYPNMTHHMLRHTILTYLAKSGIDLLDLMKFAHHVNPANTLKYVNISIRDVMGRIRDRIERIDEMK